MLNSIKAISTISTAPCTILCLAATIAVACCLFNMAEAISFAYAKYPILASRTSIPAMVKRSSISFSKASETSFILDLKVISSSWPSSAKLS